MSAALGKPIVQNIDNSLLCNLLTITDVKRKPDFNFRNETRFYIYRQMKVEFIFLLFRQQNYIKITKNLCQVKLIIRLFNIECLRKFSSNGQIWPTKKSFIICFKCA